MARKATLMELANSRLRRISEDRNHAFGSWVIFYKRISRRSDPKWRGPAIFLGIDKAGPTVKFQIQTSKVVRFCVRNWMGSSPGTPVGGEHLGELSREGEDVDEPLDVEARPRAM